MEFDLIWLALGIAAAGYFIGNGLKNFNNPDAKDTLSEIFSDDENEGHELIKENDVHYFIGISKEDAKSLIQDYPDIPHVTINNKIYYPKAKLRKWLSDLGA
ncbi:DNA-binding protein [Oceanobacillus picturae]|uniref:DNA-binding protein n=1 Tax=Oceanobacillus picturae TaxID=171693 RepID=UPI0036250FFC